MNVSCHQGSSKAYHHHHVISIIAPRLSSTTITMSPSWAKVMAPRHHIAWDPTTCINEDCEDISHQEGISISKGAIINKHHQVIQHGSTISKGYIINKQAPSPSFGLHHIKQAPSPSSQSMKPSKDHHQLSKAPWTSSTSIDLAASCCDHYKGHHRVSRLHITVVVIKDNHQAGWHQWQSTATDLFGLIHLMDFVNPYKTLYV